MKIFYKTLFFISLISISIFVIVPFIWHFTSLEIRDDYLINRFEEYRFYGLPLVILLTLFGTLKSEYSNSRRSAIILLTFCATLLSVFILIVTLFAGMCKWTNSEVLFKNVKDNTTEIILREYGCGAFDSGLPINKICKIKNISSSLIYVTDFDTAKLDRTIWLQVEKEKKVNFWEFK